MTTLHNNQKWINQKHLKTPESSWCCFGAFFVSFKHITLLLSVLQCWIWDTIGQAGKNYETRCNLEKTGSIWKYNGDILSKNRHSFVWFLAFLKKKWGNLINFKKGMEEWVRVRFFKGGLSSSNSCNNSCMHDSALFKNCKRFCYFLFIF